MPFTLRNVKQDLEDIGSRFDHAPDLEFRAATKALELEKSGTLGSGCSSRAKPPRLSANVGRAGSGGSKKWTGKLDEMPPSEKTTRVSRGGWPRR